jgi:hypothetical protein
MTWGQGRADVERLVAEGRLQRVPASPEQANFLLGQAEKHWRSAAAIADVDPPGAYQLAYDAARKALTAVLENQGLRPTAAGGHVVVYAAVRAQLDPPSGRTVRPFDRMRRNRNRSEYPSLDSAPIDEHMVIAMLPQVRALLDLAAGVLDQMDAF